MFSADVLVCFSHSPACFCFSLMTISSSLQEPLDAERFWDVEQQPSWRSSLPSGWFTGGQHQTGAWETLKPWDWTQCCPPVDDSCTNTVSLCISIQFLQNITVYLKYKQKKSIKLYFLSEVSVVCCRLIVFVKEVVLLQLTRMKTRLSYCRLLLCLLWLIILFWMHSSGLMTNYCVR